MATLGWRTGTTHRLPYFKRMETRLAGADEYRGGQGPLALERGPLQPVVRAFFEAVQQVCYPLTKDVNGSSRRGFAASTATSTGAGSGSAGHLPSGDEPP